MKTSWSHPEDILKTSWRHPEDILSSSWFHPEFILKSSWSHPEVILKSSWSHPDDILMTSWWQPDDILKISWSHHEESEPKWWRLWVLDKFDTNRQTWTMNGVAIYQWCGYLRKWCGYLLMVWLSTKKVWLFHLAFLGLLVGAKNEDRAMFEDKIEMLF